MPTRYLKPGICDSERIDRCSPIAETLYYRLLVNVDDFGRLDARPAVIRARCFPLKDTLTNKDVQSLLSELHNSQLILLYAVDGCEYLQMQKWDNTPRSKVSKYPAPVEDCDGMHASVCTVIANLPVTLTETETETSKPEPKKQRAIAPSCPPDVSQQVWNDWLALRKAKKAPVTETAISAAISEAQKAGMSLENFLRIWCARGSQGLQADWLKPAELQAGRKKPQADNFAERDYGTGVMPL